MRPLSTIKLVALSPAMLLLCSGERGNGVPAFTCEPDAAMTSPLSEVSTTMAAPMRSPLFSQHGDQGVGVAGRHRFAEAVVGGDRLRRLRQLAAIAFEQTREHRAADVQLALHFALGIAAIGQPTPRPAPRPAPPPAAG